MTARAHVVGREGAPHLGWFVLGAERFPCALGAAGIRTDKVEGDGATPAGVLPLRRLLFRADRVAPPASGLRPREPISTSDGWCDDPNDAAYNRLVRLPHPGRAERLWREDGLYDVVVPLGWNDAPVIGGRGSAIFLHVAPPADAPTAGCIGLALPALLHVLAAGLAEIEVGPASRWAR